MLLKNLEKAIVDRTRSFEARLVLLCRKLGFDHASYAHVNMTVGVISGFTTYPPSWVSTYASRNLHEQDPIIRHGLEFTRPVDWAEFRADARYRGFFGLLARSGFGRNGVTIPLKVSRTETGLLSVTKECDPDAWKEIVRKTLPELCEEAQHVHSMALTLNPMKVTLEGKAVKHSGLCPGTRPGGMGRAGFDPVAEAGL